MPRALISLTYDDALPVHRELVAPALEAHGLRGTFYVPAAADDLHGQRDAWRTIAGRGHELGNHTCFHPCRGKDGAVWPERVYDMRFYSEKRFLDEVRFADRVLRGIDGRDERTFAATCGNLSVGVGDEERDITAGVLAHARCIRSGGTTAGLPRGPLGKVVPALRGDGRTAAELIPAIDAAVAAGEWLIILFHGVGQGTHGLFITVEEHQRILAHLASHGDRLRGVPVLDGWREWTAAT